MSDSAHSSRNLDWLISVDDHILEPPNVWIDRVPAKDRDRAPHMELDENGLDYWVYDGNRYPSSGLSAVAGTSTEEFSPEPLPYREMRPGVQHRIGHPPEETQYKLLRGNAETLYGFTPAEPPVLAHA